MSQFEKRSEPIHGRTVTITSWMDSATGTWKASAPGFALQNGRADEPGQSTREEAVAQVLREMDAFFRRGMVSK